jgi:excisionase family DNA binding protein
MNNEEYISVKQAAELLGYSRVHIVRLINDGKIQASKVGRSYVIEKSTLGGIFKDITASEKKTIEQAVQKIVSDFGPTLKRLSKE